MTVLESIKLSTTFLEKKGVESPRANAELLLAEVLNCKRLELYLSFDKPLKENEINDYREFLRKRGMRIPLQYILGYVDFYGYKFFVDENVLIPRPETELLVEQIIIDNSNKNKLRILDIGSGCGNISIVLADKLINSDVIGIDISEGAIIVSEKNRDRLLKKENLNFIKFDILNDDVENLGKFDLVVSNPPYISLNDYNELEPELKNYEPKISLTDDSDGLTFYKKIISVSKQLLNTNGQIYFEIAKDQHNFINELMIENGFSNLKITKDYSGVERIIKGELL
ncbi:MAG TPA: peptide chain release factor N(5)-glutamine methyltransferase [Ignavibacteriaceae bacterium]|jgi:release factor glutamine methyltransferase|nr:MAG: Release factor glutamine methyltransferase [Ignavibacteria bacterium ADurb.Bin266]HQF42124.1 peptide chain release factor N(5)-glutamine methyltransferase [Ignavibacteriaceae bacterium]HQI41369.1 peptide chain release factor N(5)-glutamine methyltransferase [Ignavibacteriaceae bacterium]HQJ46367.1 peptide chain release factor N(5)-glutamine methyltransferase [Ignavibacteriaceae bacterium]